MYGFQNVFDDLGFSDFQSWQRKLIAERGIIEECKLQNNPCFCNKWPIFINTMQKNFLYFWMEKNSCISCILHGIVNCSSSSDVSFLLGHAFSFIHSLPDWMSTFYLVTHRTTVLSSAKICFYDLWALIWLNASACPPNSLWFIGPKGIKSNRSLCVCMYSFCWLSPNPLDRQNLILVFPVVMSCYTLGHL